MLVILMATGQCDIQTVQWSFTNKGRSRPMLVEKKGNRLISVVWNQQEENLVIGGTKQIFKFTRKGTPGILVVFQMTLVIID
jgi:hypothetical protein